MQGLGLPDTFTGLVVNLGVKYLFLLISRSLTELLIRGFTVLNPDQTWPGVQMY